MKSTATRADGRLQRWTSGWTEWDFRCARAFQRIWVSSCDSINSSFNMRWMTLHTSYSYSVRLWFDLDKHSPPPPLYVFSLHNPFKIVLQTVSAYSSVPSHTYTSLLIWNTQSCLPNKDVLGTLTNLNKLALGECRQWYTGPPKNMNSGVIMMHDHQGRRQPFRNGVVMKNMSLIFLTLSSC